MPEEVGTLPLDLLHDHYKDTCTVLQALRQRRDRLFYACLGVLGVMLFDVYSPGDFSTILADVIRKKLDARVAPNLDFLRTILWFLLLGVTTRYCQVVITIERQYTYVHSVEALLSASVGTSTVFTREGRDYLSNYPAFLAWAHILYTSVFPLFLLITVTMRVLREIPAHQAWPLLTWIDALIAAAVWVSITLYLAALHRSAESGKS